MTLYNFEIYGHINGNEIDDAMDIIKMVLEDNDIHIDKITMNGNGIMVSEGN